MTTILILSISLFFMTLAVYYGALAASIVVENRFNLGRVPAAKLPLIVKLFT